MRSWLLFGAVLAFAVVGASADSSRASESMPGYYVKARHQASRAPRRYLRYYSYRYRAPVGGHLFGRQLKPFPYSNNGYNYPGHYNNQTFWERVQTQANYPVQY